MVLLALLAWVVWDGLGNSGWHYMDDLGSVER